jgi:hypothetical protein
VDVRERVDAEPGEQRERRRRDRHAVAPSGRPVAPEQVPDAHEAGDRTASEVDGQCQVSLALRAGMIS